MFAIPIFDAQGFFNATSADRAVTIAASSDLRGPRYLTTIYPAALNLACENVEAEHLLGLSIQS